MGVPITYIDKHNPEVFEILGMVRPSVNGKKKICADSDTAQGYAEPGGRGRGALREWKNEKSAPAWGAYTPYMNQCQLSLNINVILPM